MLILRELPDSPLPPGAVAFGNFDGVHIGHQALLKQLRRAATAMSGASTVVTFWPHPLHLLRPEIAPPAVDTVAGRLAALERCGVDRVLVLQVSAEFLARSAAWFAGDVLFGCLAARVLIAGRDARFGHGGVGDLALLRQTAASVGAVVQPFEPVRLGGAAVSSSRIRQMLTDGAVAAAAQLLGRAFCLRGEVVHGDARGAGLGFPTANLLVPEQVRPAAGVYASRVELSDGWHDAVTNLGVRPTFHGLTWRAETHLLDWQGDLYGQEIAVALIDRIRDERRFVDPADLKAQILRDCDTAATLLKRPSTTSCT